MTVINDFVKNHELLKEDYRHDKGFAKFEHVDLSKRIAELNRTCVLALVGPYGSGKSTALHRARSQQLADVAWLQFDAWRYPERKALWDGLIIETAKQLGKLKSTKRAVDGGDAAIGKWGGVTTGIFATVADVIPGGAVEWLGDKFHSVLPGKAAQSGDKVKEAGPVADKLVKNLFGRSAAKRAYEFEKILTDLLVSVKEPRIVLVVEDVDRSGSDGLHFLETLSYFLNNNERLRKKGKKVIAIAPVSDESYRANEATYLKCVDYIELFRPRGANLDGFIEEVFEGLAMNPSAVTGIPNTPLTLIAYQTKYFLEGMFNAFPTEMSMRKLKLIIREASSAYRLMQIDGYSPNWLVVLSTQATKHFRDHSANNNDPPTHYDVYTRNMAMPGNNLFANTISAIADERRQDEESNLPTVMTVNSRTRSKGQSFIIDNSLTVGSIPAVMAGEHGRAEFHIQGYYFKY